MSVSDLISRGFGGYRGWQDTEADANFKATGGSGKWDPGSSQQYSQQYGTSYTPQGAASQPFQSLIDQTSKLYKDAAQPAIDSLQASKPEITSGIASKTKILQDKYDGLIASITGNQTKAENKQTVVTAGELGKRGIDPTSTIYGQEVTNAVNPITSQYTGLKSDATNNMASGITDLATLETTQLRNVSNTIAQLQSGAGEKSIDTALSLYKQAQDAAANASTLEEQRRQFDIAQKLKETIYQTIDLPNSKKKSSSDGLSIDEIIKSLGNLGGGGIVLPNAGGGGSSEIPASFIADKTEALQNGISQTSAGISSKISPYLPGGSFNWSEAVNNALYGGKFKTNG